MTSHEELLSQGWQIHQQGNYAAAEQLYRQVLAAAPANANAWCYLGIVLHDQDRLEQAVRAYRQAIQLQPNFPIAFNNLGNTLRLLRRLDEAVACFDQAIRLKPDYVNAHKNKGTALVWEGRLDEAVACYQQALQLDANDAETHKNLGVIWLLQGKFDRAWQEYEWRWKTNQASLPKYSQPLWQGEPLDGRTILLTVEQGLGDTLQFVRYAAELKTKYDCQVVLECQRALLPLLAHCPGIDRLVGRGDDPGPFDVFCPLLTVPGVLGDSPETFPAQVPYLAPDEKLADYWQKELDQLPGLKIGLAWQGNRQHEADRMRSVPLAEMAPLGKLKGIQWISLQKGDGVEQLESLAGRIEILPWGQRLDESCGAFMDTAAILSSLDLLITIDSALCHLAGALNVPTWIALAHVPDWRWLLDREDSPWYPSARLFRQPAVGDWSSVFESMAAELRRQYPQVTPKLPVDYRLASSGRNRLTRARHGLMLYNRHDKYIGRSLELYGEFSDGECDLFRQVLPPGAVVVEAGANIGAHTLPIARAVGRRGRVFAFEPQRPLYQNLCANMALNSIDNVDCRCQAVGAHLGHVKIPPLDYDQENNFGGLGLNQDVDGESVPLVTVDSLELPRCDLLKADVEGMELEVLQGASETIQRCRPILYVENDRADRSAALIEYILNLGYRLYWHLPPMFSPKNYYGNTANVFGNIVSVNMLGVHSSVKSSISGLRLIEGPQSDWRSP